MPYVFRIALCCAAFAGSMAPAADTTPRQPALATDAGARVPAVKYDSAFGGYQSYRDPTLAAWRDANNDVHNTGGHIGIVGGASGKPAKQPPQGHTK